MTIYLHEEIYKSNLSPSEIIKMLEAKDSKQKQFDNL